MDRPVCLIHANCQGDGLAELLGRHPDFAAAWDIRHHPNYVGRPLTQADLGRVGLYLYQWLAPERWGEQSSPSLLARLPRGGRAICLPNFLFKGYWPFWYGDTGMEFADRLLDQLLARPLSPAEILHIYLRGPLERLADLPHIFAATMAIERDKEQRWDIKCLDVVEAHFRSERLFNTINHPLERLSLHVADGVLALTGHSPVPGDVRHSFRAPFEEFQQPIHPQVAAFQGLAFAGPGATFQVYGAAFTFAEYAACYVDCHRSGIGDFVTYLRARAAEKLRLEGKKNAEPGTDSAWDGRGANDGT